MADATSLRPPSPGLSATRLSNKGIEPYSPKGPEKFIFLFKNNDLVRACAKPVLTYYKEEIPCHLGKF